jgi:hypothetical protein
VCWNCVDVKSDCLESVCWFISLVSRCLVTSWRKQLLDSDGGGDVVITIQMGKVCVGCIPCAKDISLH